MRNMLPFLALQLSWHLLFIVPLSCASSAPPPCDHNQLFDFEVANQETCFEPIPSSSGNVTRSTDRATVKYGTYSLKWEATNPSKLQLKSVSTSVFTIPNSWLRRRGVKVWLYKATSSPGKTLELEFLHSTTTVGKFQVNLDFTAWRGIWVKFSECKSTSNSLRAPTVIDKVNFILSDADIIYIDLLEFKSNVGKQSRDKVVPPISPFGLELYDASNTWQQTYYWSQQPISASPLTIDYRKKKSLELIESRLRNWYCDETKSTPFTSGSSFLQQRWNSLSRSIKKAHEKYDNLIFDTGKVVGPPLFCRDCRGRTENKFGFIMDKILLPLALEYYLRSRTNDVTATVTTQLPELNSGVSSRITNAYNVIAGENRNMKNLFTSYLPTSTTLTNTHVQSAINTLNLVRLNKINDLLDFVKQQGFADGSGLGSLDHEMNKDGAGFMHTLFLLKDSLSIPSNKSRLLDLINTAKWYNDFGEVYQSPTFEIKGTTADRMITLMLFRLIIVLVMPSDNNDEIKAKIRDMDAVVRWMNNALAVNEGLGGVIKPDFTGHHHKAFYGSAYVPQALHTAALVQYLLGETEFSLSTTSINNIRRGLETLRLIAVKYSTPNSVNGRMPNYVNEVLIKALLPGYAYISVFHPYPSVMPSVIPTGITVSNVTEPEMFLRLYSSPSVDTYLEDGGHKAKYYFNSLGSLDIMEAVKLTATSQGISAEISPEGHWSKNFASLSVHRRKDWAVTAKGFNRFLWDFENSGDENVYGMFASHGALLVANSETALEVHDVVNGWDWAKVPGATTIAIGTPTVDDLKMVKGRFYNQRQLAGGLTFKGSMTLKNGLFGMDFQQPDYGLTDWRNNIRLYFKKSVFFFENVLVCLGSNIVARDTNTKMVQTTLFQDKLTSSFPHIKVNGATHTSLSVTTPSTGNYTTLNDAKGNFYYIPSASKSSLKVHVELQTSKKDDGSTGTTTGTYGTAWLEHGTTPLDEQYEYAVLIPTTSYHLTSTDLSTAQETLGSEVYKVLKKDSTAHVVQFLKSPESSSTLSHKITGYIVFASALTLPPEGPVQAVNAGNCLIMTQDTTEFIYLSISSPDLNLNTRSGTLTGSDDVGQAELYHSSSREREIEVTLRKTVLKRIVSVAAHGNPDFYKPNVWVDPTGTKIRLLNLKNGFSVEVKLKTKPP